MKKLFLILLLLSAGCNKMTTAMKDDVITQPGTVEVTCDTPQRIVSECYNTMGESVVTFWTERDTFLLPWTEIAFCNQKQQKCWNKEAQLVVYNPTIK